ncbi:MAG: hypothetical protein A2W05_07710 [Candidatus Schekmanbacteria bacterium RBG_16_38_10]|uniref:Uncharacterized protein n=1 Tax=Candidatus Schekmanbacteria bacterium RBG_16_38_10 TaxID=1817879 RepID=A0A1F7RUZ5_9BACT|nr:MAG: hypothetical protein A2W05_07710 [Candidatus Schekmanbacteria bacterium RBG_16_38_10]
MYCSVKIFSIIFLLIFLPFLLNALEFKPIEKKIDELSLSGNIEQMKNLEANLSSLIIKEPTNYMGNFLLGKLYFLMAEYFELKSENGKGKNWDLSENYTDKSLIAFDNSIKENEKYFDSHFYKALALVNKIRHLSIWNLAKIISAGKENSKEKEAMLALDKNNPKRFLAEGISKLFMPVFRGGGPEKAIPLMEKAIKTNPQYDEAYYWLARAYNMKKDLQKAREFSQKAVELSPNNNKYKLFLSK